MTRIARAAFDAGRAAIDQDKLRAALTLRNYRGVEDALDGPVTAMADSFREALPDVLAAIRNEAGRESYRQIAARLRANGLRTAAVIQSGGFDDTDPAAVEWIQAHTAELITGVSDTTRAKIRDMIESAFTEEFDVAELTDRIATVIGDEQRAEDIARTETMRASNAGQQQAWQQAADDGLLTGDETQEWIVTPDDRLCPDCEDMDGDQAALGESFESETFGTVDGPPLHPRCRCTLGLVMP